MLELGKDIRHQQGSRARSNGSCFPGIRRCLHSPVGSRREGPGIAGLGTGGPLHDAGKLVMLVVRRDGTTDQVLRFLSGARCSIGLGDLWFGRRSSAKLAEVLPENVRTARGCDGTQGLVYPGPGPGFPQGPDHRATKRSRAIGPHRC